ncbi:MAG TPA: hypothetical protein VML19_21625 [Verrucomicrobiae bacterium]|nr:hypothetical protein [Verrucomicrobiae bacterium]
MSAKWLLAAPALLVLWVAKDMTIPQTTSLTRFDGREVGRLETAMWRSYYAHQRMRLFGELVGWKCCISEFGRLRHAIPPAAPVPKASI